MRKIGLPQWLDGQTIAILTLLIALGAMMQTGFANVRAEFANVRGEIAELRDQMHRDVGELRSEVGQLRGEMHREIGQLRSQFHTDLRRIDDRLRNVELDVAAIKVGLATLDSRVTALEAHHAAPPDLPTGALPPA